MSTSILDLIARKRDGMELTSAELRRFVLGVTERSIPEYQLGAMLMAIFLRGMGDRETADLTMAMVHSGDVIDLRSIPGFKVDKHSTGGVGDKVTPILGPLVASAGVHFPKLSGRGLGHTGGTLDKLESIPGFRVDLSIDELIRQVQAIGLAVTGQTAELVPADGVLYDLRDVTATVDSVPLIASSVMSKKIAAGADGIVLDVKCGRGAFMQTQAEAEALARLMVVIGESAGKRTMAVVTSMEEPLGRAVGNALEIAESIEVLRGSGEERGLGTLREVCLFLGAHALILAGLADEVNVAIEVLEERIASGAALEKLQQMIAWQGGDASVTTDLTRLPRAREVIPIVSPRAGYVRRIDARQVGEVVAELGAGRKVKGEPVDLAVGVVLDAAVGVRVRGGQLLASIHTNGKIPNEEAQRLLLKAFDIGEEPPVPLPHVLNVVTAEDAQG